METQSELPWTSEDIDILRHFLNTQTGSRLLPKMLEATPALLAEGDVNAILIRSGEVRGVQIAAQAFLGLLVYPEQPKKEHSAYPPLDDDKHWEGEKLNQDPKTYSP